MYFNVSFRQARDIRHFLPAGRLQQDAVTEIRRQQQLLTHTPTSLSSLLAFILFVKSSVAEP
jgi:hypothetical protein